MQMGLSFYVYQFVFCSGESKIYSTQTSLLLYFQSDKYIF